MSKLDEMLNNLLKVPETLEECIAYIKKNPMMSSTIEDMAFKQTVVNVLVLANLVTENDFNASVIHFKEQLFEEFGKELLKEIEEMKQEDDEEEYDDSDDWDDWRDDKNIPQA